MTEPSVGDALGATLEAMARDAAPGVLAEALDEARAEVRSILRARLVQAILDAGPRGGADGLEPVASGNEPLRTTGAPAALGEREHAGAKEQGVYLYGFTAAATRPDKELHGINHAGVYAIVEHDLAALVSDITAPRQQWGIGRDGEPDLALLAPRFEEHEQVLEAVLDHGAVLPARFGTLYPSGDDVRHLLRTQAGSIRAALERLEGKVEWGLTVTWDSQRAVGDDDGAGGESDPASPPPTSPGRAYLDRREADKAKAERLAERRHSVSLALHQAVAAAATAAVVHPVGHHGGAGADTLLRSSYLVDASERSRFEAAIVEGLEAGEDLGLRADLTGPWPPYNFATLELDGAGA